MFYSILNQIFGNCLQFSSQPTSSSSLAPESSFKEEESYKNLKYWNRSMEELNSKLNLTLNSNNNNKLSNINSLFYNSEKPLSTRNCIINLSPNVVKSSEWILKYNNSNSNDTINFHPWKNNYYYYNNNHQQKLQSILNNNSNLNLNDYEKFTYFDLVPWKKFNYRKKIFNKNLNDNTKEYNDIINLKGLKRLQKLENKKNKRLIKYQLYKYKNEKYLKRLIRIRLIFSIELRHKRMEIIKKNYYTPRSFEKFENRKTTTPLNTEAAAASAITTTKTTINTIRKISPSPPFVSSSSINISSLKNNYIHNHNCDNYYCCCSYLNFNMQEIANYNYNCKFNSDNYKMMNSNNYINEKIINNEKIIKNCVNCSNIKNYIGYFSQRNFYNTNTNTKTNINNGCCKFAMNYCDIKENSNDNDDNNTKNSKNCNINNNNFDNKNDNKQQEIQHHKNEFNHRILCYDCYSFGKR